MAKDGGALVFRYLRAARVGLVDELGKQLVTCSGNVVTHMCMHCVESVALVAAVVIVGAVVIVVFE